MCVCGNDNETYYDLKSLHYTVISMSIVKYPRKYHKRRNEFLRELNNVEKKKVVLGFVRLIDNIRIMES